MLIDERDNEESSFISMIIGTTGSGKTALSFEIINVLLLSDPSRHCQMFRVPQVMLKLIQTYAPKNIGDRFSIVEKLRDVKPDAILLIDEGLLNANAKESLKTEFVGFEKALAISRQLRIILILNTQTGGILKSYRILAHIIFYKQTSVLMVENTNIKFIKKNYYTLQKLIPNQTLFQSAYKSFSNKWGSLTLPLNEYCDWFNIKISKSYAKECFDQQFEQERIKDIFNKKIAKEAVAYWGILLFKSKAEQMLSGWIRSVYGYDTYFDVKSKLKEIMGYAVYYLRFEEREKRNKKDKASESKEIIYKEGDFSEFCRIQYEKNDPEKAEIIFRFIKGETQRTIASSISKGTSYVNTLLKKFRNTNMGYLFEDWFAYRVSGGKTDEIVGGRSNRPDYIDKNGWIYSEKCYASISKSITFYQQKDALPEYTEAKKQGKPYRWVYLNPSWDTFLRMVEVDPNGDEKQVFHKNKDKIDIETLIKKINDEYVEKIIPDQGIISVDTIFKNIKNE